MRKLKCRDVEIGFLMSDSFFCIQKLKTFFGEKKSRSDFRLKQSLEWSSYPQVILVTGTAERRN